MSAPANAQGAMSDQSPQAQSLEYCCFDSLYALQDSVALDDFRAGGLNLWPLVRFSLVRRYLWRDSSNRLSEASLVSRLRRTLAVRRHRARVYGRSMRPEATAFGSVDVLLFDNQGAHKVAHADGAYDRVLDPILDLCSDLDVRKFHLAGATADHAPRARASLAVPAAWVEPPPLVADLVRRHPDLVRRLAEIDARFAAESGGAPEGELAAAVFNRHAQIMAYRSFFRELFWTARPRMMVISGWAGIAASALILACKDLGILTVDVQHGQQGPYSMAYGRWRIPPGGFDLMPDVFWLWGAQPFETLTFDGPDTQSLPRKCIGSNPYLSLWKSEAAPALAPTTTPAVFGTERQVSKRILVTLQPFRTLSGQAPDQLVETIRRAPNDWLWTIRMHPNSRFTAQDIAAYLREAECAPDRFSVDDARDEPLPSALKRADWHLTAWSTCGYEALAFDTPTLFYYPFAREQYRSYIERGTFFYADRPDDMLALLSQRPTPRFTPEDKPFAIADADQLRRSVTSLLLQSQSSHRGPAAAS